MANYNPNSVWTSKKKPPAEQPAQATRPAQLASEKPSITPPPKEPFFKKTPVEAFDRRPFPGPNRTWLWVTLVLVLIVGGGALYFFLRAPSGPNVSIEFSKPDQVLTGDQFPFAITISNYASTVLKNATLSVFLPGNVSFVGQSPGQRVLEQVLGDIGPGSINKQEFNLIVTGDPNTVKRVEVKLVYGTDATAKTQFETDGGADIVVGGAAISVNVNAPQTIFSGQNFDFTVSYNNNTSHSFQNVTLNLQYPPVFLFARATMPPADAGNRSWNLGTIPAAGAGSIIITGNITGPDKATYSLDANLTGDVKGDIYPLTSQRADLAIGSSPLALALSVNNGSDYVAHAADNLTYTISYTNNSNVSFQNAAIKAALVGDMFDFGTLQSSGVFSSLNNAVTWYPANTRELLNVAPGQSGSVNFRIQTKKEFPIRLLSDKNYTLKMNAQMSSPTVPPGTVASSTVSVASIENKVGGAITLAAKGFWRDASSGILNAGPYPPKVNQKTQYTVHWIVTNYATDAQTVTISAYLQSGTVCTGQIKSNLSTAPTCDAGSGLVTWAIPNIPAATGVAGPPAEAIFQVENTPAVNQVGQSVTLVGPATLQATDAFTGGALQATAGAVTTDLPDDRTLSSIPDRRVRQ